MRKMKWKFNSKTMIILIIIIYLLFSSLMLIFVKDWPLSASIGDSFGIVNALFSGIALVGVIYTLFLQRETLELQREDFALSIKPLLAIELKGTMTEYSIIVTNIGNGTALNIDLIPTEISPGLALLVNAPRIISLKPGETKEVQLTFNDESGAEFDSNWGANLDRRYSNSPVLVAIKYNDIKFNGLKQRFELGLGDLRVTMTEYLV
ncbi:hypothetical protein QYF50_06580 [Paenibacillus vini]|uniref:COG1470 family protein n=1 Tax=Paenibacillus vini TaxID=1476024 RepID=UPI0025B67CD2|nr:hypothetical protein [Paenibacillus vini]MDN4067557.1 hypothetical protein [Paenibacillus vini]